MFEVPTDRPEQDGTLSWQKTTLVLVEASAGGLTSLAYTYADGATAKLIGDTLSPLVLGGDVFATQAAHTKMRIATRNLGGDGITAMAISAVDLTLWDLRLGTDYDPWQPKTHFQFPKDHGSFAAATLRCVGVGVGV